MTEQAEPPAPPSVEQLARALADPFDPSEVKWKPQTISGARALAVAFVDARVIQDRLDDVLGSQNWQDDYEFLPDGTVVCRLRLRLGEEWVMKVDVGSPSEQPDAGDRVKASVSDALKRAAVKFGLGRYLYRLPAQWVDYDPQKRQFVRTPTLPDFARPKAKGKAPLAGPGAGEKLAADAKTREAELVKDGIINDGQLYWQLLNYGKGQGFPAKVEEWEAAQVKAAQAYLKTWVQATKAARARAASPAPK